MPDITVPHQPSYIAKLFMGSAEEVEAAINSWMLMHTVSSVDAVPYGIFRRSTGELCLSLSPSIQVVNGRPHVVVVALAQVGYV